MTQLLYKTWRQRLLEHLNVVELDRDLDRGEILLITHTTEDDLRELHRYGWTVNETAQAMIEKVNLR